MVDLWKSWRWLWRCGWLLLFSCPALSLSSVSSRSKSLGFWTQASHSVELSIGYRSSEVSVELLVPFPAMLASSFQLGRRHGDDRFFCSVKAFRGHHQNLARWRSDSSWTFAFVSPALPLPSTVEERRKPETCKILKGPPPAPEPLLSGPSNLNSFLKWTCPSVQAQYLPKVFVFSFLFFFLSRLSVSLVVFYRSHFYLDILFLCNW